MLTVIFEHAHRQHHRPVLFDRLSDLMRQHHFVAHLLTLKLSAAAAMRPAPPSMATGTRQFQITKTGGINPRPRPL
jgi:hypothetical protein